MLIVAFSHNVASAVFFYACYALVACRSRFNLFITQSCLSMRDIPRNTELPCFPRSGGLKDAAVRKLKVSKLERNQIPKRTN